MGYFSDDQVREIADYLFGDNADEVIAKANPDQADLNARHKKQAKIALATNVLGITSGGAALGSEGKKFYTAHRAASRAARGVENLPKRVKAPGRIKGAFKPVADTLKNPKVAAGLAGAGLGLQAANLGGDVIANRVLSREAKKNPSVKGGAQALVHTGKQKVDQKFGKSAGRLVPVEVQPMSKAEDDTIEWAGEFSKVDEDKHLVFGWASIVKKDGQDVVDLQGDYIDIDEIEKAAYDYVIKSRKGGNQHQRVGEEPLHVSDMVESFIVTPEKIEKMGLPEDTPLGWWTGFKVNDEDTWQEVKSGKKTSFSIHGKGSRRHD